MKPDRMIACKFQNLFDDILSTFLHQVSALWARKLRARVGGNFRIACETLTSAPCHE
jgi:hypothetical protein